MDQRITIDWTSCEGHGLCAELLPEHITSDEWGHPLVAGARSRRGRSSEPARRRPTARSWL
ncbi:ferredoxin [Streptomyces sp. NPDC048419]|uniref:ferredoxin n=1 Tax=Streptomyces sp. NPDC048419 TaxID=3365547 RepID=UPI003717D921